MSILSRPLIGRALEATPLTPVGVRCARLRTSASNDFSRMVLLGVVSAQVFKVAGLCAFFLLAGRPIAGAGPLPTGVWQVVRQTGLAWFAVIILYYVGAWIVIPPVARWFFDRRAKSLTREQRRRDRKLRRLGRTVNVLLWVLVALLVIAAFALGSTSMGVAMTITALAYGGAFVVASSLFRRRGARLVCARCDYPMSTWHGASDHCPECGTRWKDPWRARLGVRDCRPRLIALGAAMMVTSIAIAVIGSMAV